MHRICGRSSSGRAPPCQGGGSEFEPRRPLQQEWFSLLNMVTWPSGKARVCKTLIHQFKSGRHLQKIPGSFGFRDFFVLCCSLPAARSFCRIAAPSTPKEISPPGLWVFRVCPLGAPCFCFSSSFILEKHSSAHFCGIAEGFARWLLQSGWKNYWHPQSRPPVQFR